MYIVWQLDLLLAKQGRYLTGGGSHNEGDLISGTVAAAAYCWGIGPVSELVPEWGARLSLPICDVEAIGSDEEDRIHVFQMTHWSMRVVKNGVNPVCLPRR